MASSISENNYRDLWKEVFKVRTKSKVTPQCMDDVTGSESIAELFANKHDMLYNSVCSNSAEIHNLLETNKDDIESLCLHLDRDPHTLINKHTHSISVIHVQEAIHKLKSAESDCTDELFSDHFINGTDRFFTLISLLFTCMLTHGVAPSGLLLSTMIPVPKDKRASKSDSNNYRAIAISSILGEIFDSIVMKEQYASLITDDLQFLSGLQEMLNVCEDFAKDYNILLNASKSKLMYFGKNNLNCENLLFMSNGSSIEFVEQCVHLGTKIYSDISKKYIDNATNDLYMRTNNLMADFSYAQSSTLYISII